MKAYVLIIAGLLAVTNASATFAPVLKNYGEEVARLDPSTTSGIEKLLEAISQELLGRPYLGGNLGEGPEGEYDQDPLYRLDVFDCTTFVETVLANAFCHDHLRAPSQMEACLQDYMQKIRYFDDTATFEARNHIAETDWIASNARRGFIRDVTHDFGGSSTKYSHVLTDKRSWFAARTLDDVQTNDGKELKQAKLARLREAGKGLEPVEVSVPYLGFDILFRRSGDGKNLAPNEELLRRLPSGAIFNVVRANWDPPGSGTPLAISHQGLIIQKPDGAYLRHASTGKSVIDVKLSDYMIQYVNSPTIRGLNVLQVQPKH